MSVDRVGSVGVRAPGLVDTGSLAQGYAPDSMFIDGEVAKAPKAGFSKPLLFAGEPWTKREIAPREPREPGEPIEPCKHRNPRWPRNPNPPRPEPCIGGDCKPFPPEPCFRKGGCEEPHEPQGKPHPMREWLDIQGKNDGVMIAYIDKDPVVKEPVTREPVIHEPTQGADGGTANSGHGMNGNLNNNNVDLHLHVPKEINFNFTGGCSGPAAIPHDNGK